MREALDLLEALGEGVALVDPVSYHCISSNNAFWRMLGVESRGPDIKSLHDWPAIIQSEIRGAHKADNLRAPVRLIKAAGREVSLRCMDAKTPEGSGVIAVVLRDVSQMRSMEREVRRKNRELAVLNMISSSFIESGDPDVVFRDILEKTLLAMDFEMGWISLWNEARQNFRMRCYRGLPMSLVRWVEEGGVQWLDDTVRPMTDPFHLVEKVSDPVLRKHRVRSFAVAPLRLGERLTGYLFLGDTDDRTFEFEELSLLSLVAAQVTLILEKIRLYEETNRLAMTDALTELYNARYFYTQLESENLRCERYGLTYSVVIFDIDGFKVFNDTYGHQAGDEVLREVGQAIKAASRQSDIVARYGGEEFVVLLPNTAKDSAMHLAVRSKEAVENLLLLKDYVGKGVRVTISGGVAAFPGDGRESKSILYAADMALYEAKRRGKKRVCCTSIDGFLEG